MYTDIHCRIERQRDILSFVILRCLYLSQFCTNHMVRSGSCVLLVTILDVSFKKNTVEFL